MKIKWSELSPRERDALVAEKVMGFNKSDLDFMGEIHVEKDGIHRELPHYTTDIAAAWEVVEKLNCQGYRVEIVCGSQGDTYVTFVIGGIRCRVDCYNLKEAICLAALKAVGVEIEP
jgi:hypothetical protein